MVQPKLLTYLQRRFPEHQKMVIRDFRSVGEGWETRIHGFTWEYTYQSETQRQKMIIRMYPGRHGASSAESEFHTIHTLKELGYPVPAVHFFEAEAEPVGMPFIIMDLIEGSTMDQLFTSASHTRRSELLNLFCELFLRLHRLEWQPFHPEPSSVNTDDPYLYINHALSREEDLIARFNLSALHPVLEWLQKRVRQVPCHRFSFTHGDFHPLNIMIDEAGAPFVIDWTAAHIGDARRDLTWTLLLTQTFSGPELRDLILHTYEEQRGDKVQEIEYFEVLAILRRLSDFLRSIGTETSSHGLREDIASIMGQHKVHYQNVYALLQERTGIALPTVEKVINGLGAEPAE